MIESHGIEKKLKEKAMTVVADRNLGESWETLAAISWIKEGEGNLRFLMRRWRSPGPSTIARSSLSFSLNVWRKKESSAGLFKSNLWPATLFVQRSSWASGHGTGSRVFIFVWVLYSQLRFFVWGLKLGSFTMWVLGINIEFVWMASGYN